MIQRFNTMQAPSTLTFLIFLHEAYLPRSIQIALQPPSRPSLTCTQMFVEVVETTCDYLFLFQERIFSPMRR